MTRPAVVANTYQNRVDAIDLVLSIGTSDFTRDLLLHLNMMAKVESLYIMTDDGDIADSAFLDHRSLPARRARHWNMVPESQTTLEIDLASALPADDDGDRYRTVILHCSDDRLRLRLSLLSSESRRSFSSTEIADIRGASRLLMCLVLKHMDLVTRQAKLAQAISSLEEIDHHMASAPEQLSPREAQVCARILYGQTTTGIALELDIGAESVMTYRKRAYRRLGIASHRELLCWYLHLRANETVSAYRFPALQASNSASAN